MKKPADALHDDGTPLPQIAACEHFAGNEKFLRKALALEAELGPVFDITVDLEDGAALGSESAHAQQMADLIAELAPTTRLRIGLRVHPRSHPAWPDDLDTAFARCGRQLAYLTIPKVRDAAEFARCHAEIAAAATRAGARLPPLHVLIETPGAVREVAAIAACPAVETLDFGLMDFVSAHQGSIPEAALTSPGQFTHPLVQRAKTAIAAAAYEFGRIANHNVTVDLSGPEAAQADARRARAEFGFLRMWSIHPQQIAAIVSAMQPALGDIERAVAILCSAQDAGWAPIRHDDRLHDRASYRWYWNLLQRARATGAEIPPAALERLFD